jgi:hypothetical protein
MQPDCNGSSHRIPAQDVGGAKGWQAPRSEEEITRLCSLCLSAIAGRSLMFNDGVCCSSDCTHSSCFVLHNSNRVHNRLCLLAKAQRAHLHSVCCAHVDPFLADLLQYLRALELCLHLAGRIGKHEADTLFPELVNDLMHGVYACMRSSETWLSGLLIACVRLVSTCTGVMVPKSTIQSRTSTFVFMEAATGGDIAHTQLLLCLALLSHQQLPLRLSCACRHCEGRFMVEQSSRWHANRRTCAVNERNWRHVENDEVNGAEHEVVVSACLVLVNAAPDPLNVCKVDGCVDSHDANVCVLDGRRVLLDVAVHLCTRALVASVLVVPLRFPGGSHCVR